jgi:N-acetylmuramoyl-L-alanine amidase
MLKSILTLGMICIQITLMTAAGRNFHTVKAMSGDGVYSLLRRYHLSSYSCNIDRFYEINKLDKKASLLTGKKYKLPVEIYSYNGTSIRSTINLDDWETAVQIQQYNEAIFKLGVRKTHYRESRILWVPYHLLECKAPKAKIPENNKKIGGKEKAKYFKKKGTITEKLFGNEYENVKILDNQLKNEVYYVVSGHGGPDPGACCTSTESMMCEDEYAYDVALRLTRNLMQHGATVHMIIQDNDGIRDEELLDCDKDEKCMGTAQIPLNQKKRLHQRAAAINKLHKKYKKKGYKTQKAIMIHIDSRSESKSQDVFFYHWGKSKTSKKLAYDLQSTFKEKYKKFQKNRGYHGYVAERGLYMLRNTAPSAVFVELANIRNKNDHKRLMYKTNRQALANWLFEGMTGVKS